ncbi:MAG: ABC transporter permease [Rhodospirillales bacterium]|jgi:peptide/nickel transport system permease protein|nr:ABC transporter permease [Rhodospirillales bacterium]
MFQFLINRLLVAGLVAFTVSILAFSLLRLSGDLAAELAGEDATQEEIAAVAKDYGLDRPVHVQYLDWAGNAFNGDLGKSLFSSEPVAEIISGALPVTVKLAALALFFSLLIAIPLGILAAVRPNTWIDRAALAFAVFGQAVPNFWFGLMLMLAFGVWLRWTPISGQETWVHFILPTVTITLSTLPMKMRLTRAGMIDVLGSDYIRTSRAKGLTRRSIVYKHALRNAILPVVSITMVNFGFLLGGTVVVETIFALNGLGFEAFQAITRADFPVVQTIVAFIAFVYIGLTLLSDLINAQLDPRIRLT